MERNPTAAELAAMLLALPDTDKPVLIETGDGILGINLIGEGSHEVFLFAGRMP